MGSADPSSTWCNVIQRELGSIFDLGSAQLRSWTTLVQRAQQLRSQLNGRSHLLPDNVDGSPGYYVSSSLACGVQRACCAFHLAVLTGRTLTAAGPYCRNPLSRSCGEVGTVSTGSIPTGTVPTNSIPLWHIPPTRWFNYQVLILVYKHRFTFFALLPICWDYFLLTKSIRYFSIRHNMFLLSQTNSNLLSITKHWMNLVESIVA